jgi:hypothetical protein
VAGGQVALAATITLTGKAPSASGTAQASASVISSTSPVNAQPPPSRKCHMPQPGNRAPTSYFVRPMSVPTIFAMNGASGWPPRVLLTLT